MAKELKTTEPEAPPLPPQPLLSPAPKPMIQPRPAGPQRFVPRQFVPPGQQTVAARRAATGARDTINRTYASLSQSLASLKAALLNHSTGEEAAAEWQREGVDAAAVKQIAEDVEALLKKHS